MDDDANRCLHMLQLDPQLEKMRWLLVPWKVKEHMFWHNYFAHIYVVRNTLLVSKMDPEAIEKASNPGE